ncbi:MAG: L-seryl-tRNA(Sec) selenium transferase [Actinobacteria bacterium]|nr:L-seryl-tRNA(Sec) selenium transferase [Actinomycetota bacterium]
MADTGLPHPVLVDAARAAIAAGEPGRARAHADAFRRRLLQRVVNGTGVLLHTNLGRAPLAVDQPAAYRNVELDLDTGRRGSRSASAGALVARACGAEAGLVVGNGAAAVLLVLAALARGREVVVSRGELVEIGGGFRIPDVMAESGARLREVGTTNRTRLADYRQAVGDPTGDAALVLKVHRSNYRIEGFTEDVAVAALAALGVPVVADLGSGLIDAACPWLADGPPSWLAGEPAARQTLAAGAAVVTFSGDKLLGGPQAGVICGRADLVSACARHPLARALRPGALVLNALQEVALSYLDRTAEALPFWRMATAPAEGLRSRAEAIAAACGPGADVVATASLTGGGTLPGVEIASFGVAVPGDHLGALRAADPPVIARVVDGRTVVDLRTVEPDDDGVVAAALAAVSVA